MATLRMYQVMGGCLDGSEMCHPDDRTDNPGCDWVIIKNDYGNSQRTFYRYEFRPGIERWMFDNSSQFFTDLVREH